MKNSIFLVFMPCFCLNFSKLAIFSIAGGKWQVPDGRFHALRLQKKISMPLVLQVVQQSVFQLQRPASD